MSMFRIALAVLLAFSTVRPGNLSIRRSAVTPASRRNVGAGTSDGGYVARDAWWGNVSILPAGGSRAVRTWLY